MLEPGDLQLLNNRAVLHGRTPFEDYEGLGRRRLMLRLWLAIPGWAPLPENMRLHAGDRAEARRRAGTPPATA
jgi:hypothetical protein